MSSGRNQTPYPAPQGGTSLFDRMNLSFHLRRYSKIVTQRWPILLLCTALGAGWYAYRAFTTPDTFEAYSIITHAPRASLSYKPQVLEVVNQYYQDRINDMLGSAVTTPVYSELRAEMPLVANTIGRIDAAQGGGSSFKLTVDATDLAAARKFAILWAEQFLKFQQKRTLTTLGKSRDELQRDIEQLQTSLKTNQANLDIWLTSNNITSIPQMIDGAQNMVNSLVREQGQDQADLQMLESSTKQTLAATGASGLSPSKAPAKSEDAATTGNSLRDTSDPLDKYSTKYRDLSLRRDDLDDEIAQYKNILRPGHEHMVNLRAQRTQVTREMNHILDEIEQERLAHIESLKLRVHNLAGTIDTWKNTATRYAALHRQYDVLQEAVDRTKKELGTLQGVATQYDLANGSNEEQFEIAEMGTGPDSPIGPNRPKLIFTGLALGFCLGLGLAYFLHRLDDRLELAQDVEEALQEPVLGQIPLVERKTDFLLITGLDQHDFFAESIRGIRSAILFGSEGSKKNQVLVASSAVPGDGKTTFTVNFAITLALAGHRVLLVDADLRRGNVHNFFQMPREPGLADVLMGEIHWLDVLRSSPVKDLDVIASGTITNSPGELLISPITQQLIAEAREGYDYVLFDGPPLSGIDDAFSLLPHCDGMLFVIRAGQTSMRFAKTALAAVRHRGARILGLVLNGITSDNPYYYYYSYYHAYYSKEPSAAPARGSPAVKMAAPRKKLGSIEDEAKARAAQKSMPLEPIDSVSKTEFFKARRAAQKEAQMAKSAPPEPAANPWKKNPEPAPSGQPEPPKENG